MSIRSKVSAHITGSGVFWPLVGLIVFVAVFYIYSVNKTVILVAQRNHIESNISDVRAQITNLESSRIGAMDDITLELAQSMGYEEATHVVYIPQKAVSVLSKADTIQ